MRASSFWMQAIRGFQNSDWPLPIHRGNRVGEIRFESKDRSVATIDREHGRARKVRDDGNDYLHDNHPPQSTLPARSRTTRAGRASSPATRAPTGNSGTASRRRGCIAARHARHGPPIRRTSRFTTRWRARGRRAFVPANAATRRVFRRRRKTQPWSPRRVGSSRTARRNLRSRLFPRRSGAVRAISTERKRILVQKEAMA